MDIKQNILETIGNTPMVKINQITRDLACTVLAKVETFNPGHSIKDRMAVQMVDDAEKEGKLRPGGTIIECTSGNTGMGLALVACVRGYKCIFTTNDKQSKEKFDILKALGAEVIVCPTAVSPEDPRSYYSVAMKLSKEIPNSCWFNQYDNLSNTKAHFLTTGPEIWEQTGGKITHLVVGVGTGGTISGTARYLKTQNPNIKVWGIDTYGSVFKKYHETGEFDEKEIYPYITEGIGEDILPKNVNFSLIDHFEKVSDKDGAVMARRLAKEEGLLLGYSAGSAMAGVLQLKDQLKPDDVVVLVFHDHGSRYVGKIFNDEWMRERGFIDNLATVGDLVLKKKSKEIIDVQTNDTIRTALNLMKQNDITQMPVSSDGQIVGAIYQKDLIDNILDNKCNPDNLVEHIMAEPMKEVDFNLSIKELHHYLINQQSAVIVSNKAGVKTIITQFDIVQSL